MSVIVLGGGLVGGEIARDLKRGGFSVTVADRDLAVKDYLSKYGVDFVQLDFSDFDAMARVVAPFDLVVGAVPGFLGYRMLETCIKAGKSVADISFAPEDIRELDGLAKEHGVTILYDIGIAPGLSALIPGQAFGVYDKLESAIVYVAGLPEDPSVNEWGYASVFSPVDVLEEYTRPARIKVKGEVVVRPAMSDLEPVEIRGYALEAFNTDGCRSVLDMPIDTIIEKTMRYPGHIAKIVALRDAGKFEEGEAIEETLRQFLKDWQPPEGFRDLLIMQIRLEGILHGKRVCEICELVDKYDADLHVSAMARTTGYTCSAAAQLIASGKTKDSPGVFPPEVIGQRPEWAKFILDYTQAKGIVFERVVKEC